MSTIINGIDLHKAVNPNEKTGIYCFVNHSDKRIFANLTSNIKLGMDRHLEKLSHGQHRDKDFLADYTDNKLSCYYVEAEDFDKGSDIISQLQNSKEYQLVRL